MTAATAYVYVIFRLDGSPCYVGKGRGRRWLDHKNNTHNRYLKRMIASARKDGRELPIIKVRDALTDDQAFEVEIALIKAIGRVKDGGSLVNLSDGGEGVRGWAPESIEKLRAARTGKPLSAETRAKIGNAHRGRTRPPTTGAAISAALTGRIFSPETCERISAAKSGKKIGPASERRKQAIRAATLAFWEKRRHQGLPLTHRTEAGHQKHRAAMLARASRKAAVRKEVG